ncbi:hypothetical protein ACSSVY_004308 [Roseovarius sp. MBR-51]
MIRRSAIVSIAITLGQLVAGQRSGWTDDQELVLDALRRSTTRLNYATDQELADYLTALSPEQMHGVTSNVKGIFHEYLVARAENLDGDQKTATLIEPTNHPGAEPRQRPTGGARLFEGKGDHRASEQHGGRRDIRTLGQNPRAGPARFVYDLLSQTGLRSRLSRTS